MFKNLMLVVATLFWAQQVQAALLPSSVEKQLNLSATAGPAAKLGHQVTKNSTRVLRAVYDFSVLGGASGATLNLKDREGGVAYLPANAIVQQVIINEITNVTGTGSITISLGVNTATDLLGNTAIASFSGITAGVPVDTAATMVKVTALSPVTATLLAGTVTAGKLNVYIRYIVGAD